MLKKIKPMKYPEKTSINLVMRDDDTENVHMSFGVFVIFLVALAAFTKFGVIDRIAEANEAEAAFRQVHSEIRILRETNKEYDEVKEEYSHYSNSFLTEEELAQADRMEIIALIEKCVLTQADVQNMQIAENSATLTINDITLDVVSQIVAALEGDQRTDYVTVSTASTNNQTATGNQPVTANIEIHLTPAGGEAS